MKQDEYIGLGVIGLKIWIESVADMTAATSLKIRFEKPDKSTIEFTSVASNKVEANKTRYGVEYVTKDGDLDQVGTWFANIVTNINGFTGPGKIITFDVDKVIAAP